MTDELGAEEKAAVRRLVEAARDFGQMRPRKNPTARYAQALAELLDAARFFAQKSDEEWARELIQRPLDNNSR